MIEMIDNDYIYKKEGDNFMIKEIYKEIRNIVEKRYDSEYIDILDIGTASGELPVYLQRSLNIRNKLYAFDNSDNLINNAKERFSKENIEFFVDDVKKFNLNKKFDVITMVGVLTIFEDYKLVLKNVLKHLKYNGILILVSIFNDYDIEVKLKFRTKNKEYWQSGYNLFPISFIENFLGKNGYKIKHREHIMPFDIKESKDSIRAWTVYCNNKRMLFNGLNLLYNLKVVIVENDNNS